MHSVPAGSLERFYREARALFALRHPNIVRGNYIGQDDGLHFLVMEYIEGQTLEELLEKKGPFPERRVLNWARQLCEVLEYLHTPHDVELPKSRQMMLASRQVKTQELVEGSPDHLGEALDVAEGPTPSPIHQPANAVANARPESNGGAVVPAAVPQV